MEREGQTALRLSEISPIVPRATPALAIPSLTPPFLSAEASGPLWVNLAQPWPENRVISYSSNPPLSHHAIKYALQPLTSQFRRNPAPSSNTTRPTPTKGPIKKKKVRKVGTTITSLKTNVIAKLEWVWNSAFKHFPKSIFNYECFNLLP